MKISEKQLFYLILILKDSIKQNIIGFFSLDIEDRCKLLNEIISQQSTELKEVE